MKRLVVTADDFGAAREVNDAVEMAHRNGILTAASLMVCAPATNEAVARARAMPALRVGLHIVLADGYPLSPPGRIPDLVDGTGRFRAGMVRTSVAMAFNSRVRRQVEHEIAAQFEAFRSTGLVLDHVNAHKHFHLHPVVAGLILKIGAAHGLMAMRLPSEPRRVLAAAERGAAPESQWVVDAWAAALRRRLRRQGIVAPDQVFGLRWSGAMTAPRLAGLIAHLPQGLSEIYLHPATRNDFPGAAAGYLYTDELAALLDPEIGRICRSAHVGLGGFSDFAPGSVGRNGRATRLPEAQQPGM